MPLMPRLPRLASAVAGCATLALLAWGPGCGASHPTDFGSASGDDTSLGAGSVSGGNSSSSSGSSGSSGFNLGGSSSGTSGGPVACPSGLQCDVSCSGSTTTISGKVYDPAGRNPLYNIVVYVPASPLKPLDQGVPTGADACSCPALYKSGAVVITTTAVDGSFKLTNAPVGTNVPLVVQVGKWRKLFHVNVSSCKDNPQPDKSLRLPSTVPAGDTNDNIPHIAVSTGSADTLECLMSRIGLPTSEYVAGAGGTGHVHVFAGGNLFSAGGKPEIPGMSGAPASPTSLWSSQSQLMPYDIVLLSCEGDETYDANPPALEGYLNAGGRVFASHYHYAWFAGPISTGQSYSAPADWGNHLATWSANGTGGTGSGPLGGTIVTTLNGSTQTFAKGVALDKWLGVVNALGQNGVPAGDLSIYQPRYNASVVASNTPSQPWITSGASTMYFSFDTPINPPKAKDGTPLYCGRAVFSDLHVAGDPSTSDTMSPPGGCSTGPLSPQEKALEFMLFDLSACVISDTVTPPVSGIPM